MPRSPFFSGGPWPLVIGLMLAGCANPPLAAGSLDSTAATPTASPAAVSGPVDVGPWIPASQALSPLTDPFAGLFGQAFALAQSFTLPTGPSGSAARATWELAPGQTDKATLQGNVLHALKPGGILLVGHAGDRVAYLFVAACEPDLANKAQPLANTWDDLNATWIRIFNTSTEWNAFNKNRIAPPIDFSQRSLLLYQAPRSGIDDQVVVANVTGKTVDLVVTGAFAQGEPAVSGPLLALMQSIPKVPDDAAVTVERMPAVTMPLATPVPQATGTAR